MSDVIAVETTSYLDPIFDPAPFSGADYSKNEGRCKEGVDPCVLCGRPCPTPKMYMRVIAGGSAFGDPKLPADSVPGDMYSYPIGTCCLRKHPNLKPYAQAAS